KNGFTKSTIGGTLTVRLRNASNSNEVIASKVLVAGDVDTEGDTAALTLATDTSERNSVDVPNVIVFGGDKLALSVEGTNASDLVKIGSGIEFDWAWEPIDWVVPQS